MSTDLDSTLPLPAIWGAALAAAWLGRQCIWLAYRIDLFRKLATWLSNRPILAPSFWLLIAPFLFTYLAEHELPGAFKQITALATFILGIVVARDDKQKDTQKREEEFLAALYRGLLTTQLDLTFNLKALFEGLKVLIEERQIDNFSGIKPIQTNTLDLIKSVGLPLYLSSLIGISIILDDNIIEFNELLKTRGEILEAGEEFEQEPSALAAQILEVDQKLIEVGNEALRAISRISREIARSR